MQIIYIEDDPALGRYVAQGLGEAGHGVRVFTDGTAGLAGLLAEPPELLITDWQLPGRSGVEVIAAARAAGLGLPILLLSVRDRVDDRVRGLDSGADDYLTKPFAFEELLARVRALGRRPAAGEGDGALRCGALIMDPRRHAATVNGAALALTFKEFMLLEFLARRAGQAVAKTVINQGVWDRDYDGRSNLLEVFIARLRVKLAGAGAPEMIETVKGVGYRLTPAS
jgi:DNA-binding response OmpR family regulator